MMMLNEGWRKYDDDDDERRMEEIGTRVSLEPGIMMMMMTTMVMMNGGWRNRWQCDKL